MAVLAMDLSLAFHAVHGAVAGVPPALLGQAAPAVADGAYNLLVRGFEKGHLYLDKEAPVALSQLADPYDPEANEGIRLRDGLLDLSYFRGRLYLYFGVTPAVVAYLPWHRLTGAFLPDWVAVTVFCGVGTLAGAALLLSVWRRHCPEAGPGWVVAGLLLLGTTTMTPLLAARPGMWEVPVAAAYAFLMLALLASWMGQDGRRAQAMWLVMAGLCAGLAAGARADVVLVAVVIAAGAGLGAGWPPAAGAGRPPGGLGRTLARTCAWSLVPLALVGLGIAAYNAARFGNPLEFGRHYQLSSDNVHGRTSFSPAFVADNFRLYFLSALRWGPVFPHAWSAATGPLSAGHGTVEFVVGVIQGTPALLLALAAPLAWQGGMDGGRVRRLGAGLALLFAVQGSVLLLFYYVSGRYEAVFLPFLVLLAGLGLLGLGAAIAGRSPAGARHLRRRLVTWGVGIVVVYSCSTVSLAAMAWGGYHRARFLGEALGVRGDKAAALGAFRQAVALANGHEGWSEVGSTAFALGRPDEAAAAYAQAVRERPGDGFLRQNLGVCLAAQGRYNEAEPQLREAFRLRPDSADVAMDLGIALGRLPGRESDSLDALRQAARLRPGSADIRFDVAMAASRVSGRLVEAETQYREALRLDPANAQTRAQLGLVLARQGRVDEAIAMLRAALVAMPGDAQTHYNLAVLLSSKPGLRDEAGHELREAVRADPGFAPAREALGRILSGRP